MKQSGTAPTKQIFMALINGYAACGELEKAKQVRVQVARCSWSDFVKDLACYNSFFLLLGLSLSYVLHCR
jgi:pentatricopeptide repeat protein